MPDGVSDTVHAGWASSLTATAWPATVNVPVRTVGPGLTVTATVTVPFPEPFVPPVMDIHARSDVAVQVHWLVVVTVTVADPPDAGTDSVVAEST